MLLPLADMIDSATNPWALALLVGGLLASFAIAAGPPVREFIRRMPAHVDLVRTEAIATAKDPRRAQAWTAAIAQLPRAAILYGLIGIILTGWAAYALTQPVSETRPLGRTQFEQVTSIGYVPSGPRSVALPDGVSSAVSAESVARTGEQPPMYSAVLSKIDFGFKYEMRSKEPLQVLGFAGTALRIKAQDGWERTLVLQPAQPLVGPQVTMLFTVDLDAVRLVVAGVEYATGAKSDWYDLTVIPVVRLAGQQGSERIDETYTQEFNLRYDRVRITPDAQLERTVRKIDNTPVEVRGHISAFGISMEVGLARWAAGIGAAVALGGAVLLVLSRQRPGAAPIAPAASKAAPPAPNATSAARAAVNAEANAQLAASVAPEMNGTTPLVADQGPPAADERATAQQTPAA